MPNVTNTNYKGTLAATTVAVAGLTTLDKAINTQSMSRIYVEIDNTDAAAIVFDAFQIQASADGSTYNAIKSAALDYTSPTGTLLDASGDLTTLAAAAVGWFVLDCSGFDKIRLQASANTTQSVGVTGKWSGI